MRRERDFLGERELPAEAYYGIQTLRALENFSVTNVPLKAYPQLIRALAMVKKAAAAANLQSGVLKEDIASAIIGAADEIMAGKFLDQFPIDILQATNTSFNMNMNEVLANRASEILGGAKGEYKIVHPNDHVNRSQSTNDVASTATRIACILLTRQLVQVLGELEDALRRKAEEFADVIKIGRTCLQDAVPMTLGQEFEGYASIVDMMRESIQSTEKLLSETNLGGTAVGTGINAPQGYRQLALKKLNEFSGCSLRGARSLFGATQNEEAVAILSGELKTLAVSLSKIASDLILLSSGPQAGLNEINLPALQPGSSIMPGKVNPVVPMLVNQVAYLVSGYDLAISMAIAGGQLEVNASGPVIDYCILESFKILIHAIEVFTKKCVTGITANREVCEAYAQRNAGVATALIPLFGYETAASVAREAIDRKMTVVEIVVERGLLDREKAEELLLPNNLIGPTGTQKD
jgi:aspartate ammonia-lyase